MFTVDVKQQYNNNSTFTFYQLVLHLWHPCRVRSCFPILTRMVDNGRLVKPAVCFSDQQACEELIHSFIRSQITPCSAIFFFLKYSYSAGNGLWPNAPNFCLGTPEISKLQTLRIYISGTSKLMGSSASGHFGPLKFCVV